MIRPRCVDFHSTWIDLNGPLARPVPTNLVSVNFIRLFNYFLNKHENPWIKSKGYGIYWRLAFGNQSIQGCSSKESRNSIICPKQDGAFPLMLRFWTLKKMLFCQGRLTLATMLVSRHLFLSMTWGGHPYRIRRDLWPGTRPLGYELSRSIDESVNRPRSLEFFFTWNIVVFGQREVFFYINKMILFWIKIKKKHWSWLIYV